jgi:hypothetical protein
MPTVPLNGDRPDREEAAPKATAPPRTAPRARATAPKATAASRDGRTPADRKLAASIAEMYQMLGMVGMGVATTKQDQGIAGTSAAVLQNSEAIAEAWMDLADKNPKVKAALKSITEVSAIGAVVGLHVTCALPFLADRGVGGPIIANMAEQGTAVA